MALNRALVGKQYPPAPEYEVCREHIREYAMAIGDNNAAYHNVESARELGHRDLIAPPTYPFSVTMRATARVMFDPDLGLDYARVVHGEQRFEFHRPITAGDRLVVHASIESIEERGSHEYLTTRCEIVASTGEPVVSTREVLVSLGQRTMSALIGWDEVSVGDSIAELRVSLRRVDLVMYAGASGDFNPIHWNDRIAAAAGLPDVIAHGMLTMAAAGRAVTDWCGDPAAVLSFETRFSRPVPVPDDEEGAALAVQGTVTEKLPDERLRLDLTVRLLSADGATDVLRNTVATVQL